MTINVDNSSKVEICRCVELEGNIVYIKREVYSVVVAYIIRHPITDSLVTDTIHFIDEFFTVTIARFCCDCLL